MNFADVLVLFVKPLVELQHLIYHTSEVGDGRSLGSPRGDDYFECHCKRVEGPLPDGGRRITLAFRALVERLELGMDQRVLQPSAFGARRTQC